MTPTHWRPLALALLGLVPGGAGAFVLPDLSPDNDRPIVEPLLKRGLWSLELGLEDATFACDCTARPEGGGELDFALGLHHDRAFRDHLAWRIGLRGGRKTLDYVLADTDAPTYRVSITYARLQASVGLYGTPWNYLTLLASVGGFANLFLQTDDDVSDGSRAEGDYPRGEAGATLGLVLLFSPGRGRSWAWSLGAWFDLGLSPVGEPPVIDPGERPDGTHSLLLDVGLHF